MREIVEPDSAQIGMVEAIPKAHEGEDVRDQLFMQLLLTLTLSGLRFAGGVRCSRTLRIEVPSNSSIRQFKALSVHNAIDLFFMKVPELSWWMRNRD